MKKIAVAMAMVTMGVFSAQYGPQGNYGYGNNGYGNSQYSPYGYSTQQSGAYFPDDYYYEFPGDYYEDDYYTNFYNDYYNSITQINWNRFFSEYRVPRPQINLIIQLNNQFPSFSSWNSYYRMNPRRWWYDRFYALQHILGPQLFAIFQQRYYDGYNPVVYYNNYWEEYYRPRYRVRPKYIQVNINQFRINPYQYHQAVGTNFGFNQPRKNNYRGSFTDGNTYTPYSGQNGGFKNRSSEDSWGSSGGFRNGQSPRAEQVPSVRSSSGGGFRDGSSVGSPRIESSSPRPQNNSGYRGGFRDAPAAPRNEVRSEAPASSGGGGFRGGSSSSGGFRNI